MKSLLSGMLGLCLGAAAWVAAEEGAKPAAFDAKAAYKAKCSMCHGADAKGNAAMLKLLKVKPAQLDLAGGDASKLAEADIAKLVMDGKGRMPAFKGKLDPDAVKSLAKFLVTLRKAPAKPAPAKAEKPAEQPGK